MEFSGERVIEEATPERIWLDHVKRYEFASRYAKEKVALDIACGTGYGSSLILLSGAKKVMGVDISPEAVDFARTKYKMSELEFTVGNILNIDFPRNYFDLVLCFETIEHVKNPEKACSELQRVLKPDGLLTISSPNRKLTSPGKSINDSPSNLFHTIEYLPHEFLLLLNKYFESIEVYGQRAVNKLFLLPIFVNVMSRFFPGIYDPGKGSPNLKKVSLIDEYRYLIAVCRKCKNKP